MRERKIIHMVIDPVTSLNEKIILLLAMESNIYVTERRYTLQYIIQDSKFIIYIQFFHSKRFPFFIRFKVSMVKYLKIETF